MVRCVGGSCRSYRSNRASLLDSLTALCTVGDPMNFGMALLMLHSGIKQAIERVTQYISFIF